MSSQEVTGFRDEAISRRHRMWGRDVPAVDIDFLVIEYDRCAPKALIEYKTVSLMGGWTPDANAKTLQTAANLMAVPFYVFFYDTSDWTFYRCHLEAHGLKNATPGPVPLDRIPDKMSEAEFVRLLYWLRGRRLTIEQVQEILSGS